jgi:hypothetical protein
MMSKPTIENGAVTFLDVLGWKGKWRDSYEAISELKNLINKTDELAFRIHEDVANKWKKNPDFSKDLRGASTEIISISDTIVILTKGAALPCLEIHAQICKEIIPESIKNGIPLRGATSYGKYSRDGNIMIGPAIDEAASWHESTNWIGVSLTPTGMFSVKNQFPSDWIQYSTIPYKKKVSFLDRCVNWYMSTEEARDLFHLMGPHVPEIAEKYLNTFAFLEQQSSSR